MDLQRRAYIDSCNSSSETIPDVSRRDYSCDGMAISDDMIALCSLRPCKGLFEKKIQNFSMTQSIQERNDLMTIVKSKIADVSVNSQI
jgi:hypothetical protein